MALCGADERGALRIVGNILRGFWWLIASETPCGCCVAGRFLALCALLLVLPFAVSAFLFGVLLIVCGITGDTLNLESDNDFDN